MTPRRTNVKSRGRRVAGLYQYEMKDGELSFSYNVTVQGERHSGTLPRGTAAKDAIDFLEKLKLQVGQEVKDRPKDAIGFAAYVRKVYLPYKRMYKVKVDDRMDVYNRMMDHFGDKLISSIKPKDIEDYLNQMIYRNGPHKGELVSSNTQNHHRGYFSAIFKRAIKDGYLTKNPVEKVDRFEERPGENVRATGQKEIKRYLNPLEYRALLAALPEDVANLVRVAVNTGMRAGELLSLTWREVDDDLGAVHLQGSHTKNGRPRGVYLNEAAQRGLQFFLNLRLAGIPEDERPVMPEGDLKVFVFRSDRPGRGDLVGFPRRQWERAVRALGWTADHPDERLRAWRFHDCRHAAGSLMVQNGASMSEVKEQLGHSSTQMSERYAHLAPKQVAQAVNRIPDMEEVTKGAEGGRTN